MTAKGKRRECIRTPKGKDAPTCQRLQIRPRDYLGAILPGLADFGKTRRRARTPRAGANRLLIPVSFSRAITAK
jgi:hypothetical protein